MTGCAYMDGEFCPIEEARLPLLDPGFTRGDAVYDTVSVWKGNFFRLEDHLDRFERSLQRARLSPPVDRAERRRTWRRSSSALSSKTRTCRCSRRAGSSRTRRPRPAHLHQHLHRLRDPVHVDRQARASAQGIDLVIAQGNRRTPPESIDPRMKNFNWLDMARGLFEALDRGGENAVLSARPTGASAEGPGFNLFLVRTARC